MNTPFDFHTRHVAACLSIKNIKLRLGKSINGLKTTSLSTIWAAYHFPQNFIIWDKSLENGIMYG